MRFWFGSEQKQALTFDLRRTIAFWTDRINRQGDNTGIPMAWIKEISSKAHGDEEQINTVIRNDEARLLGRVLELVQLVATRHFNRWRPKPNQRIKVLELGCGTGNFAVLLANLEDLGVLEVTAGDITPQAIEWTKAKLIENGFPNVAKRVKTIVASCLTQRVDSSLLADQTVYAVGDHPFHLIIKGRIGHRLIGKTWKLSYREIHKLLPENGVVLFFEPLSDLNPHIENTADREFRTSADYRNLLQRQLKMRELAWIPLSVFGQVYVIAAFVKH